MNRTQLETGQVVFDPRGTVAVAAKPLARRVPSLHGLRLGVLDNTKWNSSKLLRKTLALLEQEESLADVHLYQKRTFSTIAPRELIEQVARENDAVLTAVGD